MRVIDVLFHLPSGTIDRRARPKLRDVASGHEPQVVVDAGVWQSARSLGRYTLVGATVTPAFSFDGFELRTEPADPG